MSDIDKLAKELKNAKELRIVQIYESRWKLFTYNMYIGILRGIGSVLGATVVIGAIAFFLSYFQAVPIVGKVINEFLNSIDYNQESSINTIYLEN